MPQQRAPLDDGQLAEELGHALERSEFRLEYQPVVRLGTGRVAGAEALLRWRHPRRGTLGPGEFLPLAEGMGLSGRIGAFVLEHACRAAAAWPTPTARPVFVSVNVSPTELAIPGASETVSSAVRAAGFDPSRLILEITGAAGPESAPIAQTLDGLRATGVRLALDDFGSATSWRELEQWTVDLVKLDRDFTAEMDSSPGEAATAHALLNAANAHRIEVVAKGIESREQARRLAELGCRYGQGFFFSKPLGASGIVALLRQGTLRT